MPELLETTCPPERVAFIFNPASGGGPGRRDGLAQLARNAGLSGELIETSEDEGAGPLARQAIEDGMERVLVSGGDGSVTEAAGVLAGTGVALGVIPGGTGNLLALNLGLPTDPQEAIRRGLTEPAFPTDVGRANGEVFLLMAGMGADAQLIRDADREMKSRLGPLAYFIAGWRNRDQPPATYTITIDGRRLRRRAQTVMVANLGRVTGGVELVPGATPEGGSLQVAILRAHGLWNLLRVGWDALIGNPTGSGLLEVRRGRRIRIETRRPLPVQLDGNEAGETTVLEVTVEPGALRLVRPEVPAGCPAPEPPLPATINGVKTWAPVLLGLSGLTALAITLARRGASGHGSHREPGARGLPRE